MIAHHPEPALLLDYVSGALPEGPALAVACHLALCPDCRAAAAALEGLGGDAMADIAPAPVDGDLLERTLARLDAPPAPGRESPGNSPARPFHSEPAQSGGAPAATALPYPLRRYAPGGLGALPWRRRLRGIETAEIATAAGVFIVRLLRIAPGRAIPQHTHRGGEMTVVLSGGFSDATGHYGEGDFQTADGTLTHRPAADPDGPCLCLTVLDAPLRLTGRIGRLAGPFFRL